MKPTRTAVQSTVLALLAAMLAVACLPAVPNGPPRTAAFWYLWYPQTPTGHYTPLLQPYNSSLPKVLKQEVNEMQYAGIQIGIISWFGPGTESEATRLPLALRAADGTHFRETLYYEPEGHGNPTSAKIESDLAYIEAHYAHDRNYLKIGGRPVLFVWGDSGDDCSTLARWAAAPRAAHFWVVQKVFPGYTTCAHQPPDWHQYGPTSPALTAGKYSYSISPGFWLYTESSPRLSRSLSRWTSDLKAMKASRARWHLITTFNEMGEGTAIEPTHQYGRGYLNAAKAVLNP